jgi:hypothetical protein
MRSRKSIEGQRNRKPAPEGIIQNQFLILETLLDIREQLDPILVKINKIGLPEIKRGDKGPGVVIIDDSLDTNETY